MAINKVDSGHFMVDFRDQSRKRLQRTFKTHRDAVAFEKTVLAQVEKREYIKPSDKTVRELADEWYQKKVESKTNNRPSYRRASLIQWRNHVTRFIKPELGSIRVDGVTVSAIEKAASAWAENVSPATANKMLTTLTAIFAMAKRYDLRRDNPSQDAERLKVATEEESTLEIDDDAVYSQGEIRTLIESTKQGSRERALVMILALTGIRIGELLALDWSAVDLKAPALHVRLNLADSNAGEDPLFQPTKTKSSKRKIPLPEELVKELMAWKLNGPNSERHLVFATKEGKPYHRRGMGKVLDRIIKKAKVKRLTAHGFRHTFASLLLQSRVAITEVSHLLGHKDSSITLRVYAHFVREETGAVQNLAASILGSSK